MTIPYRERGYSVELASLTVHERYQDHAPTAQRTSALGVDNIRRSRGEMTPSEDGVRRRSWPKGYRKWFHRQGCLPPWLVQSDDQ